MRADPAAEALRGTHPSTDRRGLLSTVGVASAIMPIAKGLFDATDDATQAVAGDRPAATPTTTPKGDGGYRTTAPAKPKDGPAEA